jgi:Glycosyl hydrolases family 43
VTVTTPRSEPASDEPGRGSADQDENSAATTARGTSLRRRVGAYQVHLVRLAVVAVLLATALASDAVLHARLDGTKGALAAARRELASNRQAQAASFSALTATLRQRDQRRTVTSHVESEVATTKQQLGTTTHASALQSLDIAALDTCLNGVTTAANDVVGSSLPAAVASINSVSSSCLSLDGSSESGLVYAFDFPDPFVLPVGNEYYAFATNSAAGNIQIIQSSDRVHWTTVGDALPRLPSWAQSGATWAPSVLQRGSSYVMYYSANYADSGEQCISEAVATQPQGPYLDTSQWPIVCQLSIGGSIDPSPVVSVDGTPYLVWKSQGANGQPPTLWAQQLTADGTALVPGSPSQLLQPDQTWQHGYIEGPDMVQVGGQYLLFYSGSDWKTASYAIGLATCTGPLGPCSDPSAQPVVGSQSAFSGPGGPSLFTDPQGNWWIAFHAWLPGRVGYPFSRPLFIRAVTFGQGVPAIGQ